MAGAFTSYTVELLQLIIPMRDSGWNDILSNCMGAVAEFLLFESCGELLLKHMTSLEKAVDSWLSLWGTCAFLLVYLGFFFTLSVPLQKQTRLSDWDPAASLFVGSDGTARHAWKGQIAKLEIWNRALPDEFARKLASGDVAPESETGLVVSYEFTGAPPYGDRQQSSPKLTWITFATLPKPSHSQRPRRSRRARFHEIGRSLNSRKSFSASASAEARQVFRGPIVNRILVRRDVPSRRESALQMFRRSSAYTRR